MLSIRSCEGKWFSLSQFLIIAYAVVFFLYSCAGSVLSDTLKESYAPSLFIDNTDRSILLSSQLPASLASLDALHREVKGVLDTPGVIYGAKQGCDLSIYLKSLTYEIGGDAKTASDLATYWYLSSANAGYGDQTTGSLAGKKARDILMDWAAHGFVYQGNPITSADAFCDESGSSTQAVKFSVGLQIGRGLPRLVNAADILKNSGYLSSEDIRQIDLFIARLKGIVEEALNERAAESNLDCNRFGNHTSVALAGLTAAAAFLHDRSLLETVAGRGGALAINWPLQVEKTIYGTSSSLLSCYRNNEHPNDFTQQSTFVAGEMADRFRNHPPQTIGYPMFSLTHLMLTQAILERLGIGVKAIGDNPDMRIQRALEFYSQFFSNYVSVDEEKVPEDCSFKGCSQYRGKIVSTGNGATITASDDLLIPFLMAVKYYPNDRMNGAVICKASSFKSPYTGFGHVDPLFFRYLPHSSQMCS